MKLSRTTLKNVFENCLYNIIMIIIINEILIKSKNK